MLVPGGLTVGAFRFGIILVLLAAGAVTGGAANIKPPLQRDVNYESSGKRLCSVLGELNKATKVTIESGYRRTDWQARDLPIVVSVHDIALIDALRSIADCAHLTLTNDKPRFASAEPVYRIWRDRKRQRELDSLFTARPIGYCTNKNLQVLANEENWRAPLLQKKITLPRLPQSATHAEVLLAIARSAGVSLICEDFESHKRDQATSVPYGKEITLADALKTFDDQYTWLVDAQNRLIVGWSRLWPERHANLMPESLLSDLANKLGSSGVFIDDAAHLADYTDDAMFDWLYESKSLNALGGCQFGSRKPWQFYNKLSRQDKKLAQSEQGLSLAGFDPAYVMEKLDVPDPAIVPYLVMKMKTGSSIQLGERELRCIPTLRDGTAFHGMMLPPSILEQHVYHILVEETPHEGDHAEEGHLVVRKSFSLTADGPAQPLPVFSERIMRKMVEDAGLKWEDLQW